MSALMIDGKAVKSIECKFATHVAPKDEDYDIHFIKERIHFEDGTSRPNIRRRVNFERPFWITNEGYRNHKDKKEFEELDKVSSFKCPEYRLRDQLARALGMGWNRQASVRDLAASPYVYGTDMMSTSYLKWSYHQRWGETFSPFTISVADTETDMLSDSGEIMMMTHSFGSEVYTAVQERFFKGQINVIQRLHAAFELYLGDVKEERKINWVVEIVPTEIDVVRNCINHAHKHQPDFMVFWNIDFDMTKMLDACKRANVDPKDIFSDPSLPENERHFFYKRGKDKRITQSGVVKTIEPADNWHTAFTPASFYMVCGMAIYRKIRLAKGKEKYGLDAVLKKNIKRKKLKFKETDHLSAARWHIAMQRDYPIEYVIYNVFDCIGVELLDEATNDVRIAMPSACYISDLSLYPSQPRRLADEAAVELLAENRVWCSTSSEMVTELDAITPENSGWITTLEATMLAPPRVVMLKNMPKVYGNYRTHVGDLDVTGAYPNNQVLLNVSKYTNTRELISIQDIDDDTRRIQGLNLSGGRTNAIEFCHTMLRLPTLPQLWQLVQQELAANPM